MEKERCILVQEKVYCKDCLRWYVTGVDQCNIPSCGITSNDRENSPQFYKSIGNQRHIDKKGQEFIRTHLKSILFSIANFKTICGCPTQLNRNNDCYFYKSLPKWLRWLTPIVRNFY